MVTPLWTGFQQFYHKTLHIFCLRLNQVSSYEYARIYEFMILHEDRGNILGVQRIIL